MGRLNHRAVDNGDVEINPSGYPFEYISESVPDTGITLIKSIGDNDIEPILEFLHSDHDDDILDVGLQIPQY